MIKFEIDKFRDYIKNKKEKIRTQKSIVEKMIREEEELDDMFISEIAQEMDKREKEEEEISKKKQASFSGVSNEAKDEKRI